MATNPATAAIAAPSRPLTFSEMLEEVRRVGVQVGTEAGVPQAIPPSMKEAWALLAPYVGRPLRDIPKGLVLLFVTSGKGVMTGIAVADKVRSLPVLDRMMSSDKDEVFI